MADEPHVAAGEPSPARLLIHRTELASTGTGLLADIRLQLRHVLTSFRLCRTPTPTRVRIDDLQGRQFYASDDDTSLIDVDLPAGTYHVTVHVGALQRRYTVALDQGATFNMQLPRDSRRP